jgi:hypothetical protein
MRYEISGRVLETESKQGVPGLIVSAFDKDLLYDDALGEVMTDVGGNFQITYEQGKFAALFEGAPDIYLTVRTPSGMSLYTTDATVRFNAQPNEVFELEISRDILSAAGLQSAAPRTTIPRETFTTLTCLEGVDPNDELVNEIKADLAGASSILEMMKDYIAQVEGNLDNNARPFKKMAKLFELGKTLDELSGHYYGIAPGLRTGDLHGIAAEYGNLLGYIWGSVVLGVCPWNGKSCTPMTAGDRAQVVGGTVPDNVKVMRGINHFNKIEHAPVNIAANTLLTFMWHLQNAPAAEHAKYGYDLNGGHFAAYRAPSVYPGTPREVLRLNYRHHALGNFPPLTYLIDELVEIAAGLYLGQVLFATDHMLERYDPQADPARYHNQHFGFFLLFEPEWNVEAKRLFPFLEMPDAAVSTEIAGPAVLSGGTTDKFTTLTLAAVPDGDVDAARLEEVRKDMSAASDIMRALKSYSDALMKEHKTVSPVFDKLHTLFNAGIAPQTMNGYYRGALISWQSQGLLAAFQQNTIDIAWQASRFFSPWTGKKFNQIDAAELAKWTEGGEPMGNDPAYYCSNTVVFRTAKEKFVKSLTKIAGVRTEEASPEEHQKYGYDAHTFFFIGRPNKASVWPANKGKTVFQFNYRWKLLENIPPDCFCFDEIAQIADGLYLGQLIYATDWLKPWNPQTAKEEYKYRLFGYFLLMDEEWQQRRLRIGFDLDNT